MIFSSIWTFLFAIIVVALIVSALFFWIFYMFFIGIKMKRLKNKTLKEIQEGKLKIKEDDELIEEFMNPNHNDFYNPLLKNQKDIEKIKLLKGGVSQYGNQERRTEIQPRGGFKENPRPPRRIEENTRRVTNIPTPRNNIQPSSNEQVVDKGNINNQRRNKPIRWNPI